MNRYEIRTNRKKESIVSAAMILFNQNGYSNTSIVDIATLAQVSQVSIYNYFGNKEGLVAECAKKVLNTTLKKAKELLESSLSFEDKIKEAFQICTTEAVLMIEQCLTEIALSDPAFISIFNKETYALKQTVYLMYIEEGKKSGNISSQISTELILKLLESINNMQLDTSHIENDIKSLQRILLYGLLEK